jgi:hypothetical protein
MIGYQMKPRLTEAEFDELKRKRDEALRAVVEATCKKMGWDPAEAKVHHSHTRRAATAPAPKGHASTFGMALSGSATTAADHKLYVLALRRGRDVSRHAVRSMIGRSATNFEEWKEALALSLSLAFDTDGRDYIRQTGDACWREMYDDELTPDEAAQEEVWAICD